MADQLFLQDVSRYRVMTRDQLVEERTCLMLNISDDFDMEIKMRFRLKLCLVMSSLKQISLASGATRFKWRSRLKLTTTKSDYIWTAQGDLLWRIIDRYPQHRKLPDKNVQCQKLVKLVRAPYRLATWLVVAQRSQQHPELRVSDILAQTIESLPESWKPIRRPRKSPSSHPYPRPTLRDSDQVPVMVPDVVDDWHPTLEETCHFEPQTENPLMTETYDDTFDVSQYLCV